MKRLLTIRMLLMPLFVLSIISCKDEDKDDDRFKDDGTMSYTLGVGKSARDVLSAETFESMVIEVQYPQGYQLPQGLNADIISFLEGYCHKPDGIAIETKELSIPAQSTYTLTEVRDIEDTYRTRFGKDEELALYLFVAGGDYRNDDGNGNVLGIAHRNTSMVLFQKTIKDHSGGLAEPSEKLATNAIFRHELGHLLGLVNIGSNMQTDHEDKDHAKHCDNEDCLMFWSYNSGADMSSLLGMSSPPDFDANCKADLKAKGGK